MPAAGGRRSLTPRRVLHEPTPVAGGRGAGNQTKRTDVYGRSMTVDVARPFNDGRSFVR